MPTSKRSDTNSEGYHRSWWSAPPPSSSSAPRTGGPIIMKTFGSTTTGIPPDPQYRYPHWDDFIIKFKATFRDPACEEEHKKRMKTMKMAGDPATVFFQKLEREAKLAGRRDDTGRRGMMVATVRQGVPWSFTSIITSIRVGIPQNYDKWKERILIMYEECQRDHAYNDAHGIGQRDRGTDKKPRGQKQITAPQQFEERCRRHDKFLWRKPGM